VFTLKQLIAGDNYHVASVSLDGRYLTPDDDDDALKRLLIAENDAVGGEN
jgi:hypothetical protein